MSNLEQTTVLWRGLQKPDANYPVVARARCKSTARVASCAGKKLLHRGTRKGVNNMQEQHGLKRQKRLPARGAVKPSTLLTKHRDDQPVTWRDMRAVADYLADQVIARLGEGLHSQRPATTSSSAKSSSAELMVLERERAAARATHDVDKLAKLAKTSLRQAGVLTQAEWRAQQAQQPEMLSADELSKRLRISSRSEVLKWRQNHRLISVMPPGRKTGQKFPSWQVAIVGDDFTALIQKLQSAFLSDWDVYDFFHFPAAKCFGLAPYELLVGTDRDNIGKDARRLLSKSLAVRMSQVLALAEEGNIDQ